MHGVRPASLREPIFGQSTRRHGGLAPSAFVRPLRQIEPLAHQVLKQAFRFGIKRCLGARGAFFSFRSVLFGSCRNGNPPGIPIRNGCDRERCLERLMRARRRSRRPVVLFQPPRASKSSHVGGMAPRASTGPAHRPSHPSQTTWKRRAAIRLAIQSAPIGFQGSPSLKQAGWRNAMRLTAVGSRD